MFHKNKNQMYNISHNLNSENTNSIIPRRKKYKSILKEKKKVADVNGEKKKENKVCAT